MSSTAVKSPIPEPIRQRLKQLRAAIGRFVIVDGLSRVLAVVTLIALADVMLDRVFKMDLAQRTIMLVVIAAVILGVVFYRLIRPLSRKVTDDALILQVEGKNKALNQSLISAAQFSRGSNYDQQGYSVSMVDATIRLGSRMAEKTNFGNTINRGAFTRNLLLLLTSVIAIGAIGYGVANNEFWRTWFNRNILLTNDLWPRNTILEIEGVVGGKMTLLRGEDHKQLVRISRQSKVTDVDVTIEFDDGQNRNTQKMRRTGDLEHTLVFRNLSNEFRFRASGGDDVSEWVQVSLVDPPGWTSLSKTVDMPDYTGIETFELSSGGGPHSILEGSSLTIVGESKHDLTNASLKVGDRNWPLLRTGDETWKLSIPAGDLIGGKYTFDLADESGLRSSRPTTFTIKIKPDREPSVRATLLGISGLVVPRVRIPVSYTAGDEFAVTRMRLEHAWTGQSSTSVSQSGSMDLTELDSQLADLLGQAEIKSVAVVDIEPLEIPVDVSLRLTLVADDNNTLSGPGTGKSREFLLRVVSEEELRADLLRREIEQRKAFEIIIGSQEKLVYDLQAVSDTVNNQRSDIKPEETLDQLRDAQRRQKLVGTNVTRIADHFQDFLVEAINNRLDEAENEIEQSQSIEERFNNHIINPIRQLDGSQIVHAGQLIELTQRTITVEPGTGKTALDAASLTARIRDAIEKQNEIIQLMQEVLASMMDSETYQEIVNKVIEIKRTEEMIREKAREKREQMGNGGIFDDEDDGGGIFDNDETMKDNSNDGKEEDDG